MTRHQRIRTAIAVVLLIGWTTLAILNAADNQWLGTIAAITGAATILLLITTPPRR